MAITKNVALSNFRYTMLDSTDHISPKSGLTIIARIMKDGASSWSICSNQSHEVTDGVYYIDLTQAEMNADVIVLNFSAAGADTRIITIFTE